MVLGYKNSFTFSLIFAPVAVLFATGSPLAIAWRIPLVIINALNCEFRRWFIPHVGIKILKRVQPPFAYCNSSAPIIFKASLILIAASLLHSGPCFVFNRFVHAVRCRIFKKSLAGKTPATLNMAVIKVRNPCSMCLPAVTNTEPKITLGSVMRKLFDGKPTVSTPSDIVSFHVVYASTKIDGWY